ncbi:hypothetical protein TsocGM_05675 [Tautonia sociabilis]|uniref:HipA-like kinase domain-containing protein n=1 Tax=Tautonia sociabilis TaxID=2080755 RepID=A0A432MNI3_9BACT|nr:hypothetical protein TsocGM_05675 [Tautonia sociabilis]
MKGSQVGRSAFNDQVVGRIARALGAPVADVGLVEVVPELIQINRDMMHMAPGLAHGSKFIPDCTECLWFQYVDLPENRSRFALLSVLYGWMVSAEKQFFYATNPPNVVYSFDHDAFFPGGPAWSAESLASALASYPDVDDVIVTQCGLRRKELCGAVGFLQRITPQIIASAIGAVPTGWGSVSDDERVSLAQYLWERCQTMRS